MHTSGSGINPIERGLGRLQHLRIAILLVQLRGRHTRPPDRPHASRSDPAATRTSFPPPASRRDRRHRAMNLQPQCTRDTTLRKSSPGRSRSRDFSSCQSPTLRIALAIASRSSARRQIRRQRPGHIGCVARRRRFLSVRVNGEQETAQSDQVGPEEEIGTCYPRRSSGRIRIHAQELEVQRGGVVSVLYAANLARKKPNNTRAITITTTAAVRRA